MSSALDIIAPHIPEAEDVTYNPVLHGPDGLTTTALHQIGVSRYLSLLTGKESREDVIAVTSYGWALGMSRSALLSGYGERELPFENARIYTLTALERAAFEESDDLHELWGHSDIASYRGVGRAAIKNADTAGHLSLTPLHYTPGGVKLYSPAQARAWSDGLPRRSRK
ncbi:MAG TPA: hypothetical protein H9821_07345 [Candidatus Rothia avicola]|uniref:Uncharacterized protein n=1 Tax=Candidatus Rothia avicola TaxID=2840478 RepID=A0A9D2CPW2_9MICC|nr:hypothetical protein [Candidatus Rothia avicola]